MKASITWMVTRCFLAQPRHAHLLTAYLGTWISLDIHTVLTEMRAIRNESSPSDMIHVSNYVTLCGPAE